MIQTCKTCHDPLILTLDPDQDDAGDSGGGAGEPETVPDDLLLPCGCHFHWQCLLDQSAAVVSTLRCPSCTSYLPSSGGGPSSSSSFPSSSSSSSSSSSAIPPSTSTTTTTTTTSTTPILTRYINEGGVQENLDILPALREEAYLSANPGARPARALHTLAAEGDVQGMVELLAEADGEGEGSSNSGTGARMNAARLLAWRDPLNGGRGVLHVALEAGQEEVVWLLLWLGSGAAREAFPGAVVQAAAGMGLPRREAVPPEEDVRFVRDDRGRTAAEVCLELGAPWDRLVEGGLFS